MVTKNNNEDEELIRMLWMFADEARCEWDDIHDCGRSVAKYAKKLEEWSTSKKKLKLANMSGRITEARKARVMYLIDPRTNKDRGPELGFEISLTRTVPYSEHIANLEAQKAHLTTKGGDES